MLKNPDSDMLMDNIRTRYKNWTSLEARILDNLSRDTNGQISINLENARILNVLRKFATCHMLFETGTKLYDPPSHISYMFLHQMSDQQYNDFNNPVQDAILPEIGSRLFQRILNDGGNRWKIVQEGRYRYYVNAGTTMFVWLVIRELLFCEAVWDSFASGL
jgi:hypothetical protein